MLTIKTSNGNSYNRGLSYQGKPDLDYSKRSNFGGCAFTFVMIVIAAVLVFVVLPAIIH